MSGKSLAAIVRALLGRCVLEAALETKLVAAVSSRVKSRAGPFFFARWHGSTPRSCMNARRGGCSHRNIVLNVAIRGTIRGTIPGKIFFAESAAVAAAVAAAAAAAGRRPLDDLATDSLQTNCCSSPFRAFLRADHDDAETGCFFYVAGYK